MSVDISAKLLVGLPWEEIEPWLKENVRYSGQDLADLIYELDMEYASPWYDSCRNDWFVGTKVKGSCPVEDFVAEVRKAGDKFECITGIIGGVILSPDVT